uniref:Putative terminase n=1 Tax=viral metagenome TaxID=1070528 RepID=A0A6M3IRE1_9ZZZZ
MPRKGVWAQPTFKCVGVGASIQGYHGDIIYLDDLIGKNAMMSDAVRHDTEIWYSNTEELLHQPDVRGQNPSRIYLIGTHWAPGDLYCQVQESDPDYQWIKIKAEEDGVPTWPEKLSAEEIADMKADPKRVMVFYAQMQNDPKSTDLTDFKEEYLQYYYRKTVDDKKCVCFKDSLDRDRVVPIQELDIRFTIDPAFSESGLAKTSRTAIVGVGIHRKTGLKIVLEAWAERITQPAQLYAKVEEYHLKYRPRRWGIEAYQAQAFVLKAIREYMMGKKLHIPITALPKDVGRDAKELRIRSLLDEFCTGQIYIDKMMKPLIAEYLSFPMGQTNDLMDALAYHKQWWTKTDMEKLNEYQKREKGRFMYEVGQRRTGY